MDNYLCHFRPDSLHREPKLIVTMSSLHQLLMSCTECAGETTYRMTEVWGTYVKFEIRCPSCLHSRTWETFPKVGYSFSMNVILSGAILFTGASSAKTLRVLAEAGIYVPCDRTYGNIQSDYLFGVSKYKYIWPYLGGLKFLQNNFILLFCQHKNIATKSTFAEFISCSDIPLK